MCGIQNDGVNFLKLLIKEFAHLGLILAHFDFGRLALNDYCSKMLQCKFMKFSALAGEMWRIVHVKFQLSISLGAVEMRVEKVDFFTHGRKYNYKMCFLVILFLIVISGFRDCSGKTFT